MKLRTIATLLACSALVSSGALADEPASRWRVSAGVQAAGTLGTLPSVALVVPVFLDIRRDRMGLSTPAFRASFARIDSGTLTSGAAIANLVWTMGRLDVCPLALRGRIIGFEPCARVEAGSVDGSGSNVTNALTTNRPWVQVGLVARFRATFYDFFFFEVEVSGGAPITRDRFYFAPDRTLSQASAVTGSAGLGLGAFFF